MYPADDSKIYDPVFPKCCAKSIRLIIDKKHIPVEDHRYDKKDKADKYEIYDATYKKSKLMIPKKWIIKKYPKLSNGSVKYDVEVCPLRIYLNDDEKF